MGLVGVQENGNREMDVPLGGKNKYKRMDPEFTEKLDDASNGQDRSSITRKYVLACAIFASLNSVLLGYGTISITKFLVSILLCSIYLFIACSFVFAVTH